MSSKMTSPSHKIVAHIIGRAAFFAPLTLTWPLKGPVPLTIYFSKIFTFLLINFTIEEIKIQQVGDHWPKNIKYKKIAPSGGN